MPTRESATRKSTPLARLGLVALGLGSAGTGCKAGAQELNTKKGEKVIADWLEKQELTSESVDCPDGIKIEEGITFVCKAVLVEADGLILDVRVTQKAKGDVSLSLDTAVLSAGEVERTLRGQILDQTGKEVVATCPKRAYLVKEGVRFRCEVTGPEAKEAGGASTYEMEIEVIDAKGTWQAQRL